MSNRLDFWQNPPKSFDRKLFGVCMCSSVYGVSGGRGGGEDLPVHVCLFIKVNFAGLHVCQV